MSIYRVGVIGCGTIARTHSNAYRDIDSTEIIAAVEPDAERRQAYGEAYGVQSLYADYQAMLAEMSPDIVSICTWPPLHCEMVVAAAEAGVKAILCEKPMAFSLGEADRMVAACEQAGVKLVVGHQHRFDGNVLKAIELCHQGMIGDLRWIVGYCGSRDLLSNGTHVVDLVRFLADDSPIQWVMGQLDRREDHWDFGHPAEKMAIAHIQFENGVRAFIEQGDQALTAYAFHLCGTEGFIDINDPVPLQIISRQRGMETPEFTRVASHRAEIEEMITWLEGGLEHRACGRNGRLTHEALMAIMESSRTRSLVSPPLKTKESPLQLMIEQGEIPYR